MNYSQTLEYLFSCLPMFQRIGKAAYKNDLQSTIALCKYLGNPEKYFPSVHIAGTNGKGSVASMTASVLQEAGYRTGLYTSPHLKDFRERIRINGKMIPKSTVTAFVLKNKTALEHLKLSFFEWSFGLALYHFNKQNVDIAVIETGMGGRLDSTNVISPVLCIITNIGLDHTTFLGNSIEKIAREKAGILKKNIPAIIGEHHPEADAVFIEIAKQLQLPLYYAEKEKKNKGDFYRKNIRTVSAAVDVLKTRGFNIRQEHLQNGISKAYANTGLYGRWQIAGEKPIVIYDIGHNVHAWNELREMIRKVQCDKKHFVIGVTNDKDIRGMLQCMPEDASYYFCNASIPRALPAKELQETATRLGLNGIAYNSVNHALHQAKRSASVDDMIFVGGSAFVVAEAL